MYVIKYVVEDEIKLIWLRTGDSDKLLLIYNKLFNILSKAGDLLIG
jgi:hypothetical protein